MLVAGEMMSAPAERSWFARSAARVVAAVKTAFAVVGVTASLFVGANWLAAHAPAGGPAGDSHSFIDRLEWPDSPAGREVFARIFGEAGVEGALARYRASPGFALHPNLHYMTARVRGPHFNMGPEGARLPPGWQDSDLRAALAGPAPKVFAFGGSTMLGHGLADGETLPVALAGLLAPAGYEVFNFGSQAYDQRRGIEKLAYLLMAGHRPAHVVFLDGWNDVFGPVRGNLRASDKIVFHGFVAASRGEFVRSPAVVPPPDLQFRQAAEALPLYGLVRRWQDSGIRSASISWSRDPFVEGFDFSEAAFVFRNWGRLADSRADAAIDELLAIHGANLDYLRGLARAFGFGLHVFYQPFGAFDPGNRFVRPDAAAAPGYRYVARARDAVRGAIAARRLEMTDLSDAFAGAEGPHYIDVAHYAPAANARLAALIAASMGAPGVPR